MKQIKDPFSYSVGWGASGIMCSFCTYCVAIRNEITKNIQSSKCNLYNISLNIQVSQEGFIRGEYFCKKFDNTNPFPLAVKEFLTIKDELEENVLYEACGKEYLHAIPFKELS